jgi:hypothetical protein
VVHRRGKQRSPTEFVVFKGLEAEAPHKNYLKPFLEEIRGRRDSRQAGGWSGGAGVDDEAEQKRESEPEAALRFNGRLARPERFERPTASSIDTVKSTRLVISGG